MAYSVYIMKYKCVIFKGFCVGKLMKSVIIQNMLYNTIDVFVPVYKCDHNNKNLLRLIYSRYLEKDDFRNCKIITFSCKKK